MSFFKKAVETEKETQKAPVNIKEKFLPLREIGKFAIIRKNSLEEEESISINGIEEIGEEFRLVRDKYDNIIASVDDFKDQFQKQERSRQDQVLPDVKVQPRAVETRAIYRTWS